MLGALALLTRDVAVPEMNVPHCRSGVGRTESYFVTNTEGLVKPSEQATTTVCWNATGIVISTNNSDIDIWQTCDSCGCDNYNNGDVAEAFLAPVSHADSSPSWYYELDVGAVTSAFWGGIVHNSLGNDTVYPSIWPCSAQPEPSSTFASCQLDCSSSEQIPKISQMVGTGWWSRTMVVNWGMFKNEYTPLGNKGQPWPHWRANFYRYSYPFKTSDGSFDHDKYELSGWSSTHDPSFHVPPRFGKLTFLPEGFIV